MQERDRFSAQETLFDILGYRTLLSRNSTVGFVDVAQKKNEIESERKQPFKRRRIGMRWTFRSGDVLRR